MKLPSVLRNHPIVSSLFVALTLVVVAFVAVTSRGVDSNLTPVKRGPLIEAVYGIGTVTSRSQYRARVGTSNGIESVYVKEGDLVERGKPLLRLQDGISIKAPFKGTVTSVPFYPGETILPDTPILTMEDMADLHVLATLEQQGALRVRPKMTVKLSFESLRSQTFEGEVMSIYPQKGQFLVDIAVRGLPREILPGMTADAAIQVARHDDALLVPEAAVSNGKVLVVGSDGKRRKVDVKIGISDGQWAEVVSGDLKEGDQVVVAASAKAL